MNEDRVTVSQSKYFLYFAIALVAILMISDTVASKLIQIGPFVFSGSIVLFPITYIFGDVITEIYGYRASRKIIWSALIAIIVMSIIYVLVGYLPGASFWTNQGAYDSILGVVPRIVLAGIIAFFCGEFSNSYVLSRMKIWTNGRHLWTRTIGSTIVGEGVDTLLFYTIAFVATIPNTSLFTLIWSSYLLKVIYEAVATPLTYKVVAWLKKSEGIDTYDRGINYNPFHLSEKV